jgi:hypothetical protein
MEKVTHYDAIVIGAGPAAVGDGTVAALAASGYLYQIIKNKELITN